MHKRRNDIYRYYQRKRANRMYVRAEKQARSNELLETKIQKNNKGVREVSYWASGIFITMFIGSMALPVDKEVVLPVALSLLFIAISSFSLTMSTVLFGKLYDQEKELLHTFEQIGVPKLPFDKRWIEQFEIGKKYPLHNTATIFEILHYLLLFIAFIPLIMAFAMIIEM